VRDTVERYNLIINFLNQIEDTTQREFTEDLILKLLPEVQSEKLSEIDRLLTFVARVNESTKGKQTHKDTPAGSAVEQNVSSSLERKLERVNIEAMLEALSTQ